MGLGVKQRYEGVNGEVLPKMVPLPVEHVLQRYRDVWVPIDTYPYLAVDTERIDAHCQDIGNFAVFAGGRLMQNLRPEEGGSRLILGMIGGGVDAGLSPDSKVVVEGIANPRAHWIMNFNDTFAIGMHPFAALQTNYIYVDGNGSYQRKFAELVIVDRHSRPRCALVDFDPLAEMALTFHLEYINGPRDRSCDIVRGRAGRPIDLEPAVGALLKHLQVVAPENLAELPSSLVVEECSLAVFTQGDEPMSHGFRSEAVFAASYPREGWRCEQAARHQARGVGCRLLCAIEKPARFGAGVALAADEGDRESECLACPLGRQAHRGRYRPVARDDDQAHAQGAHPALCRLKNSVRCVRSSAPYRG